LLRTAALSLVLTALLAGCDPVERADGERALHVRDDVGRDVRLAAPARRVVSLVPATTDVVIALGAAQRLVARTDYDSRPEVAALPSVGGGLNPNLEWLAARQPDLVIGWADRQSRAVIGRLAELGTSSYAAEIETLADVRATILRLGVLLGLDDRADSLVTAIDASLAGTAASVRGRAPVDALYVIALDPLIVAGPGTFIDELLTIAGARNVAGDAPARWAHLSLEELVTRAPAAVFLATGPDAYAVRARLATLPGWSRVPAVRLGRVHPVDAAVFNRPGPEVAFVARALAAALHAPEESAP
jgi:ABC-type Fe3+-hydroxamate transport system substrate-binding protein